MNIKEYQQLALRTEARNQEHTQADRWNHGVLGFVTEFDEFYYTRTHVDMVEEFGDMMWCVTLLADVANVDLSTIEQPLVLTESVTTWAAKAADIGKRWKYYNIPPSESALTEAVCQLYVHAREYWIKCVGNDGDISEALGRNIAKLRVRYPEKFTTEAAANRDLAAERMALEGGEVVSMQRT